MYFDLSSTVSYVSMTLALLSTHSWPCGTVSSIWFAHGWVAFVLKQFWLMKAFSFPQWQFGSKREERSFHAECCDTINCLHYNVDKDTAFWDVAYECDCCWLSCPVLWWGIKWVVQGRGSCNHHAGRKKGYPHTHCYGHVMILALADKVQQSKICDL